MSPRIKWLLKNIKGRKILDIGFIGEYEKPFVHNKIIERNPTSTIIGIDLNKTGVHKHRLKNSVIGSGFYLPFKENSFDVVLLAEVLEHLENPIEILKEINRVLRKNGKLLLTTPSSFSLYRLIRFWLFSKNPERRENYRKYLGAPSHIQIFDPLSLCNLIESTGFKVLKIETKNFTFISLGKKGFRTLSFDIPLYPFNRFGEYLCIIAQK
jgi:ubiquinone/menaquinone biosynthesis C-methylase UbiE